MVKHNPFQSRATFEVDGKTYHYYDLKALENAGGWQRISITIFRESFT